LELIIYTNQLLVNRRVVSNKST